VLVDGLPLDDLQLAHLRQETAWVDPAIQLWNRSLLDNLCYGAAGNHAPPVAMAMAQAELQSVLERLPDGLQTILGEGGGLVSGGEGQRVRFGRALVRPGVRLVILDEPFRGLDREHRRILLERARQVWREATLLCITHDMGGHAELCARAGGGGWTDCRRRPSGHPGGVPRDTLPGPVGR
jgi:ATP-binding cassette subfamily B protein